MASDNGLFTNFVIARTTHENDNSRINTGGRAVEAPPLFSDFFPFPSLFHNAFHNTFSGWLLRPHRKNAHGCHPPALSNPIRREYAPKGEVEANAIRPRMKGLSYG